MKKKIFLGLIPVVIIGLIAFMGISNKNKNKYNKVKTAKVTKGNIESYLSTSGQIKSKTVKEYFGTQGKVKSVNVKVGSTVKKGEVLASYDIPDLGLAVKQAELQYNNAVLQKQELLSQRDNINEKRVNIDEEISKLEKTNNPQEMAKIASLKQQKESIQDISKERIEQADNSIKLAKITLDNARNNEKKSKSVIVCETDGVVTALNVKEGAVDNGMQPAVVVQDINNLEAVISLNKYDSLKVKVGQDAVIKSGSNEYKGKVSFKDPVANEVVSPTGKESSLQVYLDILEKGENLKIGFDSDIDILVDKAENVLKIPTEAIKLDKKGNSFVYIVNDQKAIEKKVKVGIQSDTETQILEGLSVGSKVILNPNESIKDGVMVKEN